MAYCVGVGRNHSSLGIVQGIDKPFLIMEIHFSLSEFNITGNPIPEDVADKILKYHIIPLSRAREVFGKPILISQKSGYRPLKWELQHGREGNSQHVYRGNGASDVTCIDFKGDFNKFLSALIENTEYTRFAVYPGFVHVDYANLPNNRWVYNSNWEKMYRI